MHSNSIYAGESIVLTTKHSKAIAIAPAFKSCLSATVAECVLDTDKLGTFSGEVVRQGSALDCVKAKCELGLNQKNASYGLASEGSFGPHPYIPLLPCDQEILYFLDRKLNFHLHLSVLTEKTNYAMQELDSYEQLQMFCQKALFPSHALIMRPNSKENKTHIVKGINTTDVLETTFNELLKYSLNGKVWVETDMRAHMNPTRMKVIQTLAEDLADRLARVCTKCKTPGWGKVQLEPGLECSWCGLATELIKAEIYGCTKCDHKERLPASHNLHKADPANCMFCNP